MAGRLVRRTRVTRFAPGERTIEREDSLAVEEPLEVRVNGTSFSVTMRSPGDDFDLVAGFLVSEGVIWSADQLASMRFCAGTDEQGLQTFNVIDAELSAGTAPPDTSLERHVYTSSSCGICGTASIDAVHKATHFGRLDDDVTWDAALLGSRELAVKALSLHPLVPSVNTARAIFDGYRDRLPALQEAFR